MNFDSIENLNDEDVNAFYDDSIEKTATWFGTYCKTFYNFKESLCKNSTTFSGKQTFEKCPIHCEESINFTYSALQAKCNNYCGGSESFVDVAHHYTHNY